MSVLIFNASPRLNGYTTKMLEAVEEGAASKGHRVERFNLNNLSVRGCQGCLYCREHPGCGVTNDYLASMYPAIKNAHGIVFGAPIYFYDISGQGKMWLDRLYPMLDENFLPRFPGKKIGTVYTQGSKDIHQNTAVFDKMNSYFTSFGWVGTSSILCHGTDYDDFIFDPALLEKSYDLGRTVAE